jgi:hypothetical protein
MIKYLIVGLVAVGLLVGCQDDTPVTKAKGQILSIDGRAEVVYKTPDGKYHENQYTFDDVYQKEQFHTGEKIICYVRDDGYVQEIAKE